MDRTRLVYDLILVVWKTIKPYIENPPKTIKEYEKIQDVFENEYGKISDEYTAERKFFGRVTSEAMIYLSSLAQIKKNEMTKKKWED